MNKLYPYSDIRIFLKSGRKFEVVAPYVKINGKFHISDGDRVLAAQEKVTNPSEFDDENLQWFLSQLDDFPVSYYAPRNLQEDGRSQQGASIFPQYRNILDLSRNPYSGLIDPISLVGVVRRERLLSRVSHNALTAELKKYISAVTHLGASHQRQVVAAFIAQNHYVTENAPTALEAGLKIAGNARDELKIFIKAETGHELLLGDCLQSLAVPLNPPILPAIVEKVHLLHTACCESFLGMCLLIDYFEESDGGGERLLDQAIAHSGLGDICRGYKIHREINFEGHHDQVAFDLLKNAEGFSDFDASIAIDFAKKIHDLEKKASQEIWDHFQVLGLVPQA